VSESTAWRRLGQYLGLLDEDEDQPRRGNRKSSRYNRGQLASSRLDEDIDELRARLEALERRLDG